jgi:hypothetical protein
MEIFWEYPAHKITQSCVSGSSAEQKLQKVRLLECERKKMMIYSQVFPRHHLGRLFGLLQTADGLFEVVILVFKTKVFLAADGNGFIGQQRVDFFDQRNEVLARIVYFCFCFFQPVRCIKRNASWSD